MTSPPKSDMTPKTNQSQRDSTLKTDQSQQDSSLSPNIVPDASGNVTQDSDVPEQVPDAQSNQDSNNQTKDDGDHDHDRTLIRIGDCSDYSWDAKKRQCYCEQCGCDLFFLPQVLSEEGSLDTGIMKSYHRLARHKDKFVHKTMNMIEFANRNNLPLCHKWCRWECFDPKDEDKDNEARAA